MPQDLLRQEFVQYKLVPIFGYDDLIKANEELVAGNNEVTPCPTHRAPRESRLYLTSPVALCHSGQMGVG